MLNPSPRVRAYENIPGVVRLDIPAVAPLPTGETVDTTRIVERFGEDILAAGLHNGAQTVYIKPERLLEFAEFVRTDEKLHYEALTDVTVIDRSELPIGNDERFHTVYQLRSYSRKQHLTVICPLPNGDEPSVPSLANIYKGAEWPEREAYDLMGVRFTEHPDLRRIMMPEGWPNHPLQKNVPVGGEEVPFSMTWSDPEFASLGTQILPATSVAPALPPGMNRENMIINMGPHHPSTHGVLRLVVELDGESVVRIDPDLGYLHSGFEKTGENKRYKDFVYYSDRMDYLSAMLNNFGYVLTIEKLLGVEVPPRSQVIRILMTELQRIASHLFWLGTHVMDVSGTGMSVMMYVTRERERILDLFEMVCGARLTVSYIRLGGVYRDLPDAFLTNLADFLIAMPVRIDEYERMLTDSPLWDVRLQGVGILSRDEVINMGLTGPMLRGSGVDWDLRRDMPYGGFENYDFKVPVATDGDCYARYKVRMEEMRQSLRIIGQAVKNLPDGPFKTEDRKITLPPRAELDVSMEALIHHFKLMTEGLLVPPGMLYHAIESSKGELGYFVYADGSAKPYRLHVHGPSFNNLYAVDKMSRGGMLSDIVTNIGSIDIVLGDVDR
jgi:NADH dehydrogenase I D subunit